MEYGPGPDGAPDLFTNHFKFKCPYYEIPMAPGLGVEVNEAQLAKYPWKAWQCPRMYRPDGAFNNW
jgi:galactonate dehydratase